MRDQAPPWMLLLIFLSALAIQFVLILVRHKLSRRIGGPAPLTPYLKGILRWTILLGSTCLWGFTLIRVLEFNPRHQSLGTRSPHGR